MQLFGSSSTGTVQAEALSRTQTWQRATIRLSTPSYVSEIRLWLSLHLSGVLSGLVLHASPQDALIFIGFFRNAASAAKYIGAVRWMCDYLRYPLSFESRSLTQALKGGMKLEKLKVKFKGSIRWSLLCRMVKNVWESSEILLALAFVLASMFLLRCQSELIPMAWESVEFETPAAPLKPSL